MASRWTNRVALVTGAGGGIGASICASLVEKGMIVIGCGRRKDNVDELSAQLKKAGHKGRLESYKCDITKDEELDTMFEWIVKNFGGLDVCVNNAGFAFKESLMEISSQQMREMLDVNVVALVSCTSRAVKSMKAKGTNDGHIFFINSMSGHRLAGILNFYSATKFAVTALTEGFRRELVEMNTKIRVTGISPGLVSSDFLPTTFGAETATGILNRVETVMTPKDISDIVSFILEAPANVQVHDILIRPTGEKL